MRINETSIDLNWHYLIPASCPESYNVMLYGFIVMSLITMIGWLIRKKYRIVDNIVGICWIVLWGYMTVDFTMLGRNPSAGPEMELQLFWCIREAWLNKDIMDWYLIVGNILLFIPYGVILAVYYDRMRQWWKILLAGFGTSMLIEALQLLFRCGLFEIDDLFHNTLGCYLGYCLYIIIVCMFDKDRRMNRRNDFAASVISWMLVIVFFGAAVLMGQPVFGRFII